ncbi:hypothetical protein ACJJTC_002927 [Scirpophaga incertulas]
MEYGNTNRHQEKRKKSNSLSKSQENQETGNIIKQLTNEEQAESLTDISNASNNNKSNNCNKKRRERNEKKRLDAEKEKYKIKPACAQTCRKKCWEKFSEQDRQQIWTNFRNLTKQNQRNFITRNVIRHRKKYITTENSKRHNTLTWTLRNIKVCKPFFLNTLGFFNAQTVMTILKANYKMGVTDIYTQEAAPEQRGTKKPWNVFPEGYKKGVKEFIENVKPTVSHYNLKHAPNRRYLPCGVSFRDLFKAYILHCEETNTKKCSWTYFHNIVKEMNLSTANPRQDLCTTCQKHKDIHDDENHICSDCDCEVCTEFPTHKFNYTESRKCLENDLKCDSPTVKVFTVDMQKAICMPKLTIKDYYFSRKVSENLRNH